MRIFILFLGLILASCKHTEENKISSIEHDAKEFTKIEKGPRFWYDLPKKIIPDRKYDYWHYAHSLNDYVILYEEGDTLLRKKISKKPSVLYEATRGYCSDCSVFVVTIQDNKVNYVRSEAAFRTFLGKIDNVEEAILLAKTFGYFPNGNGKGSEYLENEDRFVLHLTGFNDFNQMEFVEVNITKDGFVKTKSLGFE